MCETLLCAKCLRRQSSSHSPINHCRIRTKQDNGQTRYYLIEQKLFDSLYNLITYYRNHPLRSSNFSQILTEPIPQPDEHKNKPYVVTGFSVVYCTVTCIISRWILIDLLGSVVRAVAKKYTLKIFGLFLSSCLSFHHEILQIY